MSPVSLTPPARNSEQHPRGQVLRQSEGGQARVVDALMGDLVAGAAQMVERLAADGVKLDPHPVALGTPRFVFRRAHHVGVVTAAESAVRADHHDQRLAFRVFGRAEGGPLGREQRIGDAHQRLVVRARVLQTPPARGAGAPPRPASSRG